ncbi:unnamed protein product, partial [Prorocentrum cordatum]
AGGAVRSPADLLAEGAGAAEASEEAPWGGADEASEETLWGGAAGQEEGAPPSGPPAAGPREPRPQRRGPGSEQRLLAGPPEALGAALAAARPSRTAPREPGCYVRSPAGCPGSPQFALAGWTRDYFGEEHRAAGSSRAACEVERRAHFAGLCGVPEVEARLVPEAEGAS